MDNERWIRVEFERINRKLNALLIGGLIEMATLADLAIKVQRNNEVDASAILLLQGIKAALDEAILSGNPAEIQRLSDELGTSTEALAAAVAANTPTVPPPGASARGR